MNTAAAADMIMSAKDVVAATTMDIHMSMAVVAAAGLTTGIPTIMAAVAAAATTMGIRVRAGA